MPDSELRIKTVGGEEAKRTFKSIQDSARQLDKLSVKSSFSPKEIDSAKRALSNYFKEWKSGLVLLREHERGIALIEKRTSDAVKKQKEFAKFSKEWHEQERDIRRLGKEHAREESGMNRLMGAMTGGPRSAQQVQDTLSKGESGGGFGSRLGRSLIGGIGLGTAVGIATKSISAANSINDNLVDMASSLKFHGYALNKSAHVSSNMMISGIVEDIQKGRSGALAQGLGFSRGELAGVSSAFAKTGGFGQTDTAESGLTMLNLQRRFGVDPSSFMGVGAAGAQGGRNLSPQDMKTMTAQAFASGLQQARFGEFMDSVSSLMQQMQQQGSVSPSATGIGSILSTMGAGSGPLLQGSRGAQVLGQLNQSLMNPGGGIAGQLSMLNVGGFGAPGQSWWQTQKRLSRGFEGEEGKQTLINLLKQSRSYGPEGAEEYLSFVGGLNPMQAETLAGRNRGGKLERDLKSGKMSPQALGIMNMDMTKSVDEMKEKGLGPALASLNARAALSNSFQDIGQSVLNLLALILTDVHDMAAFAKKHPALTAASPVAAFLAAKLSSKAK